MDDQKFDELSKALAAPVSRRRAMKLVAATAGGTALSLIGPRTGSAARCRRAGQPCRQSSDCCSRLCSDTTKRCVCPPPRVNERGNCVCPQGTISCGNPPTEFSPCCAPDLCCGNNQFCCPPQAPCSTCPSGQSTCCPPGTHCSRCELFGFDTCCPPDTDCVCDPFFGCRCV